MSVLLFLKKHWFKCLSILLCVGLSVYSLMFGISKARNYEVLKGNKKEQTIYTVWHIETFEGGGKARIDYLKAVARDLEKQNNQMLFMIKNVNPQNLENELLATTPDIISFGFGVGKIVLPHLSSFDTTFDVRDEMLSSGSFNKKFYAVPYIVSGYAMFNHSANLSEFHVGQNEFISPKNIYNKLNLKPFENESPYEAYKDFVYNKNVQLLGTGRDLFRVNNLNNIGRTNAMITPIATYTDLIQYLGIVNMSEATTQFVELALSETYQNSLSEYSLFSSKYDKLYYSGIYNDMENAIYSCQIPNVFA